MGWIARTPDVRQEVTLRIATLWILFLSLLPAPAGAQGINLNWNDCTLGAPSTNKNDACDSDVGPPHRLVVSLDPSGVIDQVIGVSGVITLRFDAAVVPGFWQMQPGGVRAGALQIDPFIGSTSPPFSCPEPWSQAGSQTAAVSYVLGPGPNEARIDFSVSVPVPITMSLHIAPDWYLAGLDILRDGTTTSGGCNRPACIEVEHIVLHRMPGAPGGNIAICDPAGSKFVSWQGGEGTLCPPIVYPPYPGPPQPCPDPTPAFEPTWGRLKQMYR